MPVGVVHIAALSVGQFKLHPGQGFLCHGVQLADDQRSLLAVVEAERLDLALLDENGLGGAVQHIALQRLGFPRGDGGAGLQALNHDAAVFVGDILSVALAYHGARAVRHQEGHALQGCGGAFDVLLDHQSC